MRTGRQSMHDNILEAAYTVAGGLRGINTVVADSMVRRGDLSRWIDPNGKPVYWITARGARKYEARCRAAG